MIAVNPVPAAEEEPIVSRESPDGEPHARGAVFHWNRWMQRTQVWVEAHPGSAILAAIATGICLGMCLKRRDGGGVE